MTALPLGPLMPAVILTVSVLVLALQCEEAGRGWRPRSRTDPGRRVHHGVFQNTLPKSLRTSSRTFPTEMLMKTFPQRGRSGFGMGVTEVTNEQYEAFDPSHREVRERLGFSTRDDEPVIFVSWYNATNYCKWLSEKTGRSFRLPTEASGNGQRGVTTLKHSSYFWTGDTVPDKMQNNQVPVKGLPKKGST